MQVHHLCVMCVQEMNKPGEAIVHFQRAAELQLQMPIEALLSLEEMASCKILSREYCETKKQDLTL